MCRANSVPLGARRLFWCQLEDIGHSAEFGKRTATANLTDVLDTLDYSIVWWFDPLDVVDPWKSCKKSGFCEVTYYDRTMGLWIEVATDSYLTVAGLVPTTTFITLQAGWNLIGYPTFSSRKVSNVFSLVSYERIEGFDPTKPPEYLRLMGDDELMTPLYGFWVKMDAMDILTIM